MKHYRNHERIYVDIPVMLSTVLEMQEGVIRDLSPGGAQIVGATWPQGTQFQIDWEDQTVYALVMWSEVDRMGVRFPFTLREGPLYDAFIAARQTQNRNPAQAALPHVALGDTGFARIQPRQGFGRRNFV